METVKNTKLPLAPKKSLIFKGSMTVLIGFLVNTAFMLIGIGGLLREATRLSVIVGVVLIVIGILRKGKTPIK